MSSHSSTPLLSGIHEYRQNKNLSPCPALNALCNHNAYGMPRNGRDVSARTLTNAIVKTYNLHPWLACVIVYGAFFGITRNFSFKVDLQRLCEKPIPHFAALVHADPLSGRVKGCPDKKAAEHLLELAGGKNLTLETFALWRNEREGRVEAMGKKIPLGQRHVAAGELSLLLQVFGDNSLEISHAHFQAFVEEERLPDGSSWSPPTKPIGLLSTVRVSRKILTKMDSLNGKIHIPLFVFPLIALCLVAGVVFVIFFVEH